MQTRCSSRDEGITVSYGHRNIYYSLLKENEVPPLSITTTCIDVPMYIVGGDGKYGHHLLENIMLSERNQFPKDKYY